MADETQPAFTPVDPHAMMRREAQAAKIKRFYKQAAVGERDGRHALLLDGRAAKTPARRDLVFPTAAAAALVAEEWNQQGDIILPFDMAATRLSNSIIDGVADAMAPVAAEVVKYAASDLLFYRADAPQALVDLQAAAWNPVLDWSRERIGARFYLAEGIVYVTQPPEALAAVAGAVDRSVGHGEVAAFRLGALHVMTTLTGSALLALAVLDGALIVEDAWAKAHVDEDFQIDRWGSDSEAEDRRARRWADMRAAAAMIAAVG